MMLARLLDRLDEKKLYPVVVTLIGTGGPVKDKIEAMGIEVYSVNMKSKIELSAFARLYSLIKKVSPDILHTQLYAADILGRIAGKLLKVPVIITSIRNESYGGSFRHRLIKWTERFADRTTFVSKKAAARFAELGVVPREKLKVIYNGLDPNCFYTRLGKQEKQKMREEFKLPKEKVLLLAVGSLTRQKGYPDLFIALKHIYPGYTNWHLMIAGNGPLKEELQANVERLGLEEKVTFLGHFNNISMLMAAADILVLSSLWEGLPGVVMEAMASELPVVATAVGGTPELIEDGINGYLVEPEQPAELAVALKKIIDLTDEEKRAMGKAGRNKVQEKFHVDKMVKAYESLYHECLREKKYL